MVPTDALARTNKKEYPKRRIEDKHTKFAFAGDLFSQTVLFTSHFHTMAGPTCCDFFFRVLFGDGYARVASHDDRATVTLNLVRDDGTVETICTDMQTFIRYAKQKDQKESKERKEWQRGRIVHEIDIPEAVWERLKSSPKHRNLYPRLRAALEGYKRNKLAFHEFLAILDSIQGDEGRCHRDILSRLPWQDFVEMARTSRKVESDGANALHWALCRGGEDLTLEQIQEILQVQPALVRQTSTQGSLPIHIAAYVFSISPSMPVLQCIIQAYPQGIEQIHETGMPPLFISLAVKQPDFETFQVLLEAYPAALSVTDRYSRNALHVAVQCEKLDMRIIHSLLEQGSTQDLLSKRTKEMGVIPLHLAVICHPANTDLTRLLLSHWADGAKEISREGLTALHFAVLGKEVILENVRLIHGAWPDALRFRDSRGLTPLHLAIHMRAGMDVISFLLDSSSDSVYSEQISGGSLLHLIMTHQNASLEVSRRIYEAYPGAIREVNSEGMMPLHVALFHGVNEDAVRFLLEKWQGSVRVSFKNGYTALHCAVRVSLESRPLKENDTELEGTQDGAVSSPTEEETLLGPNVAVKNLHSYNENCDRRSVVNVNVVKLIHRRWPDAIKTPAGQLCLIPLTDALISGAPLEVIKYLHEEWPEGLTLQNQAIPPLHAAMTGRCSADVVDFLIQENPNSIWESSELAGTPLHMGIRLGAPLECINLLLDKCGPARAARMQFGGDLLLHCALKARADIEIIRRLVSALPGALLEQDREGILPRDYALLYRCDLQPRLKQMLTFRTNHIPRAAGSRPTNQVPRAASSNSTPIAGGRK